jgi:hypothetical protein
LRFQIEEHKTGDRLAPRRDFTEGIYRWPCESFNRSSRNRIPDRPRYARAKSHSISGSRKFLGVLCSNSDKGVRWEVHWRRFKSGVGVKSFGRFHVHLPDYSGEIGPGTCFRLEDSLRNGSISASQIRQQLPGVAAKAIIDGATLSPLQARFARLPLQEKLQVWDLSLPREKQELQTELKTARQAYIKTHPPVQRAQDPIWRKLQNVFGN